MWICCTVTASSVSVSQLSLLHETLKHGILFKLSRRVVEL